MLHHENHLKSHKRVIDDKDTACAISDLAVNGVHIVVPDGVDIPLPRDPADQIAVPASINGRDLSHGKP